MGADDQPDEAFGILRTVEQLAAFNATAKALMATGDMRSVLDVVQQTVNGLLGACAWALFLVDDERGGLKLEVGSGDAALLRSLELPLETGLAARALASERYLEQPALTCEACFFGVYGSAARGVLAIPLRALGRPLGVLELVADPTQPRFTDEQRRGAESIADLAAMAIQNAMTLQRLQELTLRDDHTGLFNARHLHEELERELGRSRRFHRPLSLLFLDLDHFKAINDEHGHLAGSAVLREVGALLLESIRTCDSAYRYGGDEFAVLLVETNASGAATVATRIRDRVRSFRFSGGQELGLTVTASIGVATAPGTAISSLEFIRAADRALYAVKASGRDDISSTLLEPAEAW
ncbi:MAG: sensor domain-containing diguanylate cyclase [Archangium sp.]|nr:sensor domain-containing diguanylate cyclase [Archangium sp.]